MKKLLIFLCLTALSPVQATTFSQKAARTIANGLFYLIASSDASEKTTSHAKSLLDEVGSTKKLLAVRKFNRFGKFLFGAQNTITIPYLNYLIVDNEGMENLSEDARKFVLGRCMMTLSYQNNYLIRKYALPCLMKLTYHLATTDYEKNKMELLSDALDPLNLLEKFNEELAKYDKNRNHKIDIIPDLSIFEYTAYPIGAQTVTTLLGNYFSRGIEYELDRQTVQKLQCKAGAIDYLEQSGTQSWKQFFGQFAYEFTGFAASALSAKTEFPYGNTKTMLGLYAKFVNSSFDAVAHLPGQNNSFCKRGGIYGIVPYLKNIAGTFPTKDQRIDALDNPSKKTAPQKLLNELEKHSTS